VQVQKKTKFHRLVIHFPRAAESLALPWLPRNAWSPFESELADRAAVYFEQLDCSKAAPPLVQVRTKAIKPPRFVCLFLKLFLSNREKVSKGKVTFQKEKMNNC
jgi:hypothetical protein